MTRIEKNTATQSKVSQNQVQSDITDQTTSSSKERWIPYLIGTLVLLLDFVSKEIIRSNLPLYTYWAPFPALEPFFRITHTSNTGVAFGLFQFQSANLVFSLFALVISVGIVVFNQKLEPGNALLRVALGLQLGGALGNLLDRVTQGAVTDFLDFGPWPVFNVADTAVVAGVILMGYVLLQEELEEREKNSPNQDESAAG